MSVEFDFGGLRELLNSMPVLSEKDGPYTFEEKDGVVHMYDRRGRSRGFMPKDVYDDIMKMEQASK